MVTLLEERERTLTDEIARRKQAEDDLQRERDLLVAGPVVTFRWDVDDEGTVQYVSPNISAYGYTPEEFTSGRRVYASIVDPADIGWINDDGNDKSRAGLEHWVQEYRIARRRRRDALDPRLHARGARRRRRGDGLRGLHHRHHLAEGGGDGAAAARGAAAHALAVRRPHRALQPPRPLRARRAHHAHRPPPRAGRSASSTSTSTRSRRSTTASATRRATRRCAWSADVIRASIRESDVVGRVGGDEFVILAEDDAGVTAGPRRRACGAGSSAPTPRPGGRSASRSASARSTGSPASRPPCRSSSNAPTSACTTTNGPGEADAARPGAGGTMTQTKPIPEADRAETAAAGPVVAAGERGDARAPRGARGRRRARRPHAGRGAVHRRRAGARCPRARPADVDAACAAAREAQAEWARASGRRARGRAPALPRPRDRQRAGDPRPHPARDPARRASTRSKKCSTSPSRRATTRTRAAQFLRPRRAQGALPVLTSTRVHHRPRGVVGIIAPWNYPFTLSIGDALPALVAGNGVVLKPDAQTPLTGLWAAGLLEEAGLPAGLLQVVTGRGAELGTPLIDAADFIMFTGSTATGRKVAAQCGERLMGCAMELGGKNALLVLPDAPPVARRARRRPGHHLQRRPALHQHRARLRARRHLRRLRAAPRRAAPGAAARLRA